MSEINKSKKSKNMFEVKWYRKNISDMVKQIDNERFLKAIYISVRDYLKENEPV